MFAARYYARRYFAARYFPATGAAPSVGSNVDVYSAIADVLNQNSALQTAFGYSGWLWLNEAPADAALPCAVLSHVATLTESEAASARSSRARVESRRFQVTVFAESRDDAATLAIDVAEAIEAAGIAGTLTNDSGTVIDVCRSGVETDALDPDPSPDGDDVWSRVIEMEGLLARS